MSNVLPFPRRRWLVVALFEKHPRRWARATIAAAVAFEAILPGRPELRDWEAILDALESLVLILDPGAERSPASEKAMP